MSIEVNRLLCTIEDSTIFQDLSLSIPDKSVFHIQADNGAGKTTLLQVLCGLKAIEAGDVLYQHVSIYQQLAIYQKQIMYLGHQIPLSPDLTIHEHWHLYGLSPEKYQRAVNNFSLHKHDRIPVARLSYGQQKKAALMQLMLMPKSIWILDEPFVGLDAASMANLINLIENQVLSGGCVILTSHQSLPALSCPVNGLAL